MKGIFFAAAILWTASACAQNSADPLFPPIRNNNLPALEDRLTKGATIETRDAHGNTPLMYAAAYGSAEGLELLLKRGANPNAKNDFDATALLWAANDPVKARLLIAKGADVNARSKNGRTPLLVAATCDGCSEIVRLLLAKGADVNAADNQGETALLLATWANDTDAIRLLLEKGAHADAADFGGSTPLMNSATNCNLDAVRLLLARGARVNAANTFAGEVKFGKIQIIHVNSLMFAAPYCPAPLIGALLDAGANVNDKDSRNMTALMFAVASETQDIAVAKRLIAAGADVNVKSNMGETALDWAAKFGNRETIALLKSAGARNGDPFTRPARKAAAPRTAAQSVTGALAILQRSSAEFFRQSGCVGCHHQPIATMAFASARAAGLPVDENAARDNLKTIQALETRGEENRLEHLDGGGVTDPPAYFLFALGLAQQPPDGGTDATAIYLATSQRRDGTWRVNGTSRSPIQESVIGRSALAARAIQIYSPPARKPDVEARLARLRDWLLEAKPATNDDFAMRMLGLRWTGATPASVSSAAQALLARQRSDGGWAQNSNLASDAYATGQALWALHEIGALRPSDKAYQRGVQFLLANQWEDGSWYVRSRAVKLQPYFQSGFPYNHDQWISSTATGYAVMALAPAAAAENRAAR